MLGPGSIFLSEGRWLVRADLLLKTPACKHWGCCTLLSLVLREHLSSPPCCATVPPASWGKMSPLVTPHPSVSSAHAMGACCCTERHQEKCSCCAFNHPTRRHRLDFWAKQHIWHLCSWQLREVVLWAARCSMSPVGLMSLSFTAGGESCFPK